MNKQIMELLENVKGLPPLKNHYSQLVFAQSGQATSLMPSALAFDGRFCHQSCQVLLWQRVVLGRL